MSSKPYENPLIPNKLLREIYVAMTEIRALGKPRSRSKAPAMARNHEALWVAPLIALRGHPEDLISEPGVGSALDVILGARLRSLAKSSAPDTRRLPVLPGRLDHLLGAALALKALGNKGIVFAYAAPSALSASAWMRLLSAAQTHELPLILVMLPDAEGTQKSGPDILKLAHSAHLPAIPVEAADPIAIYRVAQESIVRARAGGGAALIAGITLPGPVVDPVALLHRQLLARRACTAAWLAAAEQKVLAAVANLKDGS